MTAPYIPYSQQNYADWKARFERDSQVGGLLRYAKLSAGLTDQPEQAPQGPALLQAPPQEPPPMPPAMQAPEPTPEELHEHRKGLRGGLLHLLGADRQAPEVAALLSPEERDRIRPGVASTLWNAVVEGKGPQTVQQERAANVVGLRDVKRDRDRAIRNEQLMARIQGVAATMPPQEAAEYVSRMSTALQLPGFDDTAVAAERMRPRAPVIASRGAAVEQPDGTFTIPSPIDPPRPSVVQVRTKNQSGAGVVRSVNEETGQVYWEMPAPPTEAGGLGGTGRPPTEAESKDYVFAGLMRNAMPDIRATADNVRPEVITAIRTDPLGVSKIALTSDERVFWRAVLEFAAAANRKESGAAITATEVSNTLDRYVDSGFDGPPNSPVRRAKARARENYLNLLDRTSARARAYYDGNNRQGATGKPMTPEAYRDARDNGYTDEEIIAAGYIIPDR